MLELVGARGGSVAQSFLELGTMFRSFWGQLPCSFYPSGFYAFYATFTMLALGGLTLCWRRLASTERAVIVILIGWFLLVVASWMRWNAMTPAPGGRLLFPALPAVALLMALGIDGLARDRLKFGSWIAIGALLLLAVLDGFLHPARLFCPSTSLLRRQRRPPGPSARRHTGR